MSYHGTQDATATQTTVYETLAGTIGLLDAATAEHGVTYDKLPGVGKARELLQRGEGLRTALRGRRADAATEVETLAARYATDTSRTGGDLLDAAMRAASLTDDVLDGAGRYLDTAARTIYAAGVVELRKVTEDQWIAPLRPIVVAVVAEANGYADVIGIAQPRAVEPNTRTRLHPWSPTPTDLENLTLRHAWENLAATLDRLDDLHAILTELRRVGLVPLVPGRDWCEDYRWLDLAGVIGQPDRQREFWLANRSTAKPGIYTSTELQDGTLPTHREAGADRFVPSLANGAAVAVA